MMKRFLCFLAVVLVGFVCSGSFPREQASDKLHPVYHLVVLYTNDTHGHPVKFHDGPVPDVGGLPARATLVKEIRSKNPNILVLDAGDLNTGGAESDFFKAAPDILGYNYIGYDAMVLGNHEFDNPIEVLKEQMAKANFPFLSANIRTKDGNYIGIPYIIKQFADFKVAVLGLTTKETQTTGNPENIKGLLFEDEVAVAKKLVPELRKQADIVIALTHLGIYKGYDRGSKKLATQISGIDLIVDGNTNTKLEAPIIINAPNSDHKTLIVQAWHQGLVLGRIDLWIQDRKVIDCRMELIPINLKEIIKRSDGATDYHFIGKEIKEDEELLKLLQPYVDKVETFLSERIGYAEKTFWNKEVRKRETALGDLVADSILWYMRKFNPDFAFQNGGAIRAAIPEGPIRKKTIFDILPFDSTAVVLSLKGNDVQALFDYVATIKPGNGAFPQVSNGISFTINRGTGRGENILIDGSPIDPDRTYKVVTNSYLGGGGDGYKVFLKAVDRFDSSTFQKNILVEYIKHLGGNIKPEVKGRITVLDRLKDAAIKQMPEEMTDDKKTMFSELFRFVDNVDTPRIFFCTESRSVD